MNEIQRKTQLSVKPRIGVSNSGIEPTVVWPEMTRDEWDGFYGELDWQLRLRNFKNYTGLQLLSHLAVDSGSDIVLRSRSQNEIAGEGCRTARFGYKCGWLVEYEAMEWDSNPTTLTAVIREVTEMSMVALPKMKAGSFAGDNKVPDLSVEEARSTRTYANLKQVLSIAIDKEPYKAIMTAEATDIRSDDSLSSFDPLVWRCVCW